MAAEEQGWAEQDLAFFGDVATPQRARHSRRKNEETKAEAVSATIVRPPQQEQQRWDDEEFVDVDFGPDPEVERIMLEEAPPAPQEVELSSDSFATPERWLRPRDIEWHAGHHVSSPQALDPVNLMSLVASGFGSLMPGSRPSSGNDGGADWPLFRGTPRADDVLQGALGDCWFVSALASLAEFNGGHMLKALFDDPVRRGQYTVNLCVGGVWRKVVVDDRLPGTRGRSAWRGSQHMRRPAQLLYCRTARKQLWASLVEKAYAKYCGSYEALGGGWANEAFEVLTGWPVLDFVLEEEQDSELLWVRMLSSKERGYLMTLSTHDRADVRQVGLRPTHCYSILEAYDGVQRSAMDATTHRLLKIRNPHGSGNWNGDWSRGSPLWTEELRAALGYGRGSADDDGVFYMSFSDAVNYFHRCTLCQIRDSREGWMQTRGTLHLESVDNSGAALEIEVLQNCTCTITMNQEPQRLEKSSSVKLDFPFVVLRARDDSVGDILRSDYRARSQFVTDFSTSSDELILSEGRYFIIPLSLMCQSPEVRAIGLPLRLGYCVVSSGPIIARERTITGAEATVGMRHFVRESPGKEASPSESYQCDRRGQAGLTFYTYKQHGATYCWIDNESGTRLLKLRVKMLERSGSVLFSVPPTLHNMESSAVDEAEVHVPPGKGILAYAAIIVHRTGGGYSLNQQWEISGLGRGLLAQSSYFASPEHALIEPGLHTMLDTRR
mmetsp:Transcript_12658/g.46756  ORF Transcript_12658/g.46756 Transcript_12658/m.46756 type:complete len:723 (-) Transcript_12658:215-2383(-)